MKANEAPERLYLSKLIYGTFLYQSPDPDDKTEVEYTRTDAFIEKAWYWLQKNADKYVCSYGCVQYQTGLLLMEFEKYMKGE